MNAFCLLYACVLLCGCYLQEMASCAIFSNPANTVKILKRRSPYSGLFGWNSGEKLDNLRPPQKVVYHDDVQLPFSLSLVNKTFLKGNINIMHSSFFETCRIHVKKCVFVCNSFNC